MSYIILNDEKDTGKFATYRKYWDPKCLYEKGMSANRIVISLVIIFIKNRKYA